jgi:hypothetical protein
VAGGDQGHATGLDPTGTGAWGLPLIDVGLPVDILRHKRVARLEEDLGPIRGNVVSWNVTIGHRTSFSLFQHLKTGVTSRRGEGRVAGQAPELG